MILLKSLKVNNNWLKNIIEKKYIYINAHINS